MTLAIYGGSFNPPHNGHVAVARHALDKLKPDVFLWMPSGDPPHKRLPPGSPPPEQRLELSRLAVSELAGVTVSDFELRGGARYTVDTVLAMRSAYAPDKIWLVMGSDMFLTLESWFEPEKLLTGCAVAVFCRAGGLRDEVSAQAGRLRSRFGAEIALMEHSVIEISSTDMRNLLITGGGKAFLPPAVYEYILKEGLYGLPSAAAGR